MVLKHPAPNEAHQHYSKATRLVPVLENQYNLENIKDIRITSNNQKWDFHFTILQGVKLPQLK